MTAEEQRIEDIELEEKMARFGHTSFVARCFHVEKQTLSDPKGFTTKTICKNCAKELS